MRVTGYTPLVEHDSALAGRAATHQQFLQTIREVCECTFISLIAHSSSQAYRPIQRAVERLLEVYNGRVQCVAMFAMAAQHGNATPDGLFAKYVAHLVYTNVLKQCAPSVRFSFGKLESS